jgi:hypothetical protein
MCMYTNGSSEQVHVFPYLCVCNHIHTTATVRTDLVFCHCEVFPSKFVEVLHHVKMASFAGRHETGLAILQTLQSEKQIEIFGVYGHVHAYIQKDA